MSTHPIEGLMKVAMENIKEMVDVNTIVGDPVETQDGTIIMPISKVGFGFAAGGSEFRNETDTDYITTTHTTIARTDAHNASVSLPFGGGSGGGVSITPIAFLVVSKNGNVKVVPLDNQTHIWERLIDSAPQVVEKVQSMIKGGAGAAAGMGAAGGMAGMAGAMPGMAGGMSGGMTSAGSTSGSTSPTVNKGNDNQNFIV
ncbi:GerW family sporulation protein [Paenibacillus chartarius]|uniref:GerW family sporulation protein n=1 Tax=Paenibacillus chartarius TaxID=747481 RepID=A0ABV6DNQ3_9BACL